MILVFPMAGLSSRFSNAGYRKPKYMLDVDVNSVFYHSVNSFKRLFNSLRVVFVYRDVQNTKGFIKSECQKMGLCDYEALELCAPTEGQAETVYLGLKELRDKEDDTLLVFNIDTFRPGFRLPSELNLNEIDGYLEVFEAEGDHWSFVLPENEHSNRVIKTTEKDRISSLCSSGLYYFKSVRDYNMLFERVAAENERVGKEFYIAPMYNYLINSGGDIRFSKIDLDEIVFCGTPDEYLEVREQYSKG